MSDSWLVRPSRSALTHVAHGHMGRTQWVPDCDLPDAMQGQLHHGAETLDTGFASSSIKAQLLLPQGWREGTRLWKPRDVTA